MIMAPMFFALCAFAGAFHVLAPDHWIPASVISWRRKLGGPGTLVLALLIYAVHCLLGAGAYFLFRSKFPALSPRAVETLTWGMILALAAVRAVRFSRFRDFFYGGSGTALWGYFTLLGILGPAESAVPILAKAHELGVSYLSALGTYFIGTYAGGIFLIFAGRLLWDRPHLLPRGIQMGRRMVSAVPVAAGVALGLTFLLQLHSR